MSTYLFTTLISNDLGLLARSLPIAREVAELGHKVIFCSPASAPRTLVDSAGFENLMPDDAMFRLVSGEISAGAVARFVLSPKFPRNAASIIRFLTMQLRQGTNELWNIDHFMVLFGMNDPAFTRALVDAYLHLIERVQPDVIVDFWNPFACIAARAAKIPLITVIQSAMHPASDGFLWWKTPPADLPSPLNAVNRVLSHYGLPAVDRAGESLLGDLTLVVGIPELDPLPESADVTYVGPLVWQEPDATLPDWVEEFADGDYPLIWVYPGNLQYVKGYNSAMDSAVVLESCITAFRKQPVRVVVTTGHHALSSKYYPLPRNFRHAAYLPGIAMALKSDLLIHHGGYGSCQTGLLTGTPSLIIPTYSEREGNARRIADANAGDYVLPDFSKSGTVKIVDPDQVCEMAMTVLNNDSYLRGAQQIQAKLRTYGGAAKAARLITEYA